MLEETKKIIKLVAIYARVSTGRQENEETIKNQLMVLRESAEKNGYTIVNEYVDDGWSGDMLARPSLDILRNEAKNKIWEAVLVYDPDRLARRYSYQELIMDELKELGLEIIFTTIPAPKNPEEKILHGVRGLFAEYERAKIAERFRLGKLRKAKEGHVVGTEAPFGYKYIKKQDKQQGYYKIDECESEVVKMIFNWVANEGMTLRGIVRRLQELKIKPRKSKMGIWHTSVLSRILTSRTYIGESYYLRTRSALPKNPKNKNVYKRIKKTSRVMRPEEEWIKIPCPPIIDKELFERVGRQLKKNFAACVRNRKNEYLLAGKISCTCGRTRTGEGPQHGKHLYYRCTDRVCSYPLPPNCHERGINARILDDLVWKKVYEIMTSPELIEKEANKWISKRSDNSTVCNTSIDLLEKEINKLEKEDERYIKAYGAEAITLEKLKEHSAAIREQISSLRGQVIYLEQQKRQPREVNLPEANELVRFCQNSEKMLKYLNFEVKQKIAGELIETVVGNQKEVKIDGFLPINQDYYVEFKTQCRNCGAPKRWEIHLI